ncbi:MAG TPA: ATP-dependent DNA helicase [Rhizomicrobium sp.]|jgi:ATP-dependent DNA helicase DinG|nr:ATP-dependent DNA helicase [Rhizomicrobium sp.]
MTNIDEVPGLFPAAGGALLALPSGETRGIGADDARALFRSGDVLVAHAIFVAGRLKVAPNRPVFDALELFAFVRPTQPCVPSPLGLARALMLPLPDCAEASARTLHSAARALLNELRALPARERERLQPLASSMLKAGWRWAPLVLEAIGHPERTQAPIAGFDIWRALPKWEDETPPGKPGSAPVLAAEAMARLHQLVGGREPRPEQSAYAEEATHAFAARERAGAPKIALIEAGTGVGKTLGYLAPASLWAEKNGPGLWIATYTRNLQRQIVQEVAHLYPDPAERDDKVVVRKGRENYLCLLNFEEAAKRVALAPGQRAVVLALIARWLSATADGDISGAGFPAFLAASFPLGEITDRRGECVYAACPHYRTCFIERAIRRARHAPIVIANHALVIAQAGQDWLGGDDKDGASERHVRYVFDEGHHLFDAADSGFSAFLSGQEMAELRRWIRGPEGRVRTRMRGLEERLKDIVAGDEKAQSALGECIAASGALAGEGWMARLHTASARGAGEGFLAEVYRHVRARTDADDRFYALEAETLPLDDACIAAAHQLGASLERLIAPLLALSQRLRKQLDDKAAELETYERARLEAAARGLDRRAKLTLPSWVAMLQMLESDCVSAEFVDWFEIVREDGREMDIGLRRHWVDPTIPLAQEVLMPSHGALITSATLRDAPLHAEDWQSAEVRTGAAHLPEPPKRASFGSPFHYAEQARVFIVGDVNRRDVEQLAAAYRELFLASGGGALGLFTAVRALRAVEQRISTPLAEAGLNLYAQHVDRLDTGALVDLFRAEENACLLGTDALRDGMDVPGRSLRLVVFDKVPWPKPTILHKARRTRFGKSYDDLLTRLRLKQAFGRLIRSQEDKGCFVILESATPSRLLSAFPPATPVRRCGFAEAIREIREFLQEAQDVHAAAAL